jgi:glycine hydroxymethyltransferase
MQKSEMTQLAALIADVVKATTQAPDKKDPSKNSRAKYIIDINAKAEIQKRVNTLMDRFPVYPQLDLELLKKYFVNE